MKAPARTGGNRRAEPRRGVDRRASVRRSRERRAVDFMAERRRWVLPHRTESTAEGRSTTPGGRCYLHGRTTEIALRGSSGTIPIRSQVACATSPATAEALGLTVTVMMPHTPILVRDVFVAAVQFARAREANNAAEMSRWLQLLRDHIHLKGRFDAWADVYPDVSKIGQGIIKFDVSAPDSESSQQAFAEIGAGVSEFCRAMVHGELPNDVADFRRLWKIDIQ